MEKAAERIALLLSEMRAAKPGIAINKRVRTVGEKWEAEVRAGFANGAYPKWGGSGATETEAIEDALSSAHHYWVISSAGRS